MFRILLCSTFLITMTTIAAPPHAQPPGSSGAFVSNDPTIQRAVVAYSAGQLREAEQILGQMDRGDLISRDELLQLIPRLRREYSLDPSQLLEKLRPAIPDVTSDDIETWIKAGALQTRILDGQIRIFRREPGHLLRFCPEAIQRRDRWKAKTAPPSTAGSDPEPSWSLQSHLAQIIDQATASGKAEVCPVRHTITYTLTVKPHRRARVGSILRAWLPFPQVYARQRDVTLLESSPPSAIVAEPATDGNPVTGPAQRTVFFEHSIVDPNQPQVFRIRFQFTTSAFYPHLDDSRAVATGGDEASLSTYLVERPPHIVFTPEIRQRVREIVAGETNPLVKARRIFHNLDDSLRWTPEEEYCLIPNLSMHGLKRGKGDCGVAAMLFITLCRAAGVPARWQSGWTTRPEGWNMHDWAEIYVAPWGWIPVDASYGRQPSENPAIRDFYFGHTDSYRLIVNLDYGRELSPPKRSFRSEPLDFQRGEVELDGQNLYFDDWDYQIEFERDPGP
ncbi:MAG: transglutaminase domain-containing protein [Phycisphaerae bacterium]|nr:transglutaminase domain-containing protein [Phycisphaerae bacterium]MDW8261665.1 transglutaminase domain-containing protein [Phycisphaerales bacterium]